MTGAAYAIGDDAVQVQGGAVLRQAQRQSAKGLRHRRTIDQCQHGQVEGFGQVRT